MARTESRTKTAIWGNDEFTALPGAAQRMYWLLYSQPTINLCGVLALTMRKWAGMSSDGTVEEVEACLRLLDERGFIVVDWDTEEVFVRTFIHHDGVARSPKTLSAARGQVETVTSSRIRSAVRAEFQRLDTQGDTPSGGVSEESVDRVSATPSDREADRTRVRAHAVSCLLSPSPVSISVSAPPSPAPPEDRAGADETQPPREPDPLVERWLSTMRFDKRYLPAETDLARNVITLARQHLDERVIDECIGACAAEATRPPTSSRYLLKTCQNWAAEHGLKPIPDLPAGLDATRRRTTRTVANQAPTTKELTQP